VIYVYFIVIQPGGFIVGEQYSRTLDDVRKCASKLTGVQGLEAVLHLLNSYDATRICEVPEEQFTDFVDRCELLMSDKE